MWGIFDSHNWSIAISSDVTHVSKCLMSELDGKTRKQTTELSKISYCVEVLIEVGLIPGLFAWEKILLSQ